MHCGEFLEYTEVLYQMFIDCLVNAILQYTSNC